MKGSHSTVWSGGQTSRRRWVLFEERSTGGTISPIPTMDYDPFIESQLTLRN